MFAVVFSHGNINARDVISDFSRDAEASEMAANYSIIAVREAIADCRAGKFTKAIPVLKKYAAENDIGATYVLANLYLDGLGIEKSEEAAIELLSKNIAGGHTPSMVRLGLIKEKKSPAEALQLYRQASSGNDSMAHLKLGDIFENGLLDTRANPKLAFKYYDRAHQNKDVLGTYHVARCYDQGIGVSPNAIESTRLFRQAAMAGAGSANAVMARRYFEGIGVESDPVAAVGWLMRGAQAGSTEAMVLLGRRYEAGDVIGRDLNQAGKFYSAAAKRNDPVGRYCLAMMYLNGTGTAQDKVRAFVLLEGARSYPKAQVQFDKLVKEMTPQQLSAARQKIADAAK
jgi:TPR repeat protein